MSQPLSRFEATLNLACAAMTMLFCGELKKELEQSIPRCGAVTPLREEFGDVLIGRKFGRSLAAAINDDGVDMLSGPAYYCFYPVLRFLLYTLVRPSTILQALCQEADSSPTRNRRIAGKLGLDTSMDVFASKTSLDLDALWVRLREKLIAMRGGQL